MIVLILEKVIPSLRGELTRWLVEPKTGVFVGRVSKRVRELLWLRVAKGLRDKGAALMVFPAQTEQGFSIMTLGKTSKLIQDFEGLTLPKKRASR